MLGTSREALTIYVFARGELLPQLGNPAFNLLFVLVQFLFLAATLLPLCLLLESQRTLIRLPHVIKGWSFIGHNPSRLALEKIVAILGSFLSRSFKATLSGRRKNMRLS